MGGSYEQKNIEDSFEKLKQLIQKEILQLEDSKLIYIGGFGQGCSMALATYLMLDKNIQLGGVIGCSGLQCDNVEWENIDIEAKKKTPIFLSHGKSDTVTPLSIAKMTYEAMKDNGLDHFEFIIEPIEH